MIGPIYHPEIEQNTPEWDAIKAGKWSCSSGAKIMGGLETQGLKDLVKSIAWGRACGVPEAGFSGRSTQRGHAEEAGAREAFAFSRDVVVEQMGFVEHGRIPHLGWSPDGLHTQRRRGVEIKCLEHKAFMDFMDKPEVPSEYRWQTKMACMVGRLEVLDFWVYHPHAGGICIEVIPNPSDHDQIEGRIHLLEQRVAPLVERLVNFKGIGLAA